MEKGHGEHVGIIFILVSGFMLCNVNRRLFPFNVWNNAFPGRALPAYTTSAPASQGGGGGGGGDGGVAAFCPD